MAIVVKLKDIGLHTRESRWWTSVSIIDSMDGLWTAYQTLFRYVVALPEILRTPRFENDFFSSKTGSNNPSSLVVAVGLLLPMDQAVRLEVQDCHIN